MILLVTDFVVSETCKSVRFNDGPLALPGEGVSVINFQIYHRYILTITIVPVILHFVKGISQIYLTWEYKGAFIDSVVLGRYHRHATDISN